MSTCGHMPTSICDLDRDAIGHVLRFTVCIKEFGALRELLRVGESLCKTPSEAYCWSKDMRALGRLSCTCRSIHLTMEPLLLTQLRRNMTQAIKEKRVVQNTLAVKMCEHRNLGAFIHSFGNVYGAATTVVANAATNDNLPDLPNSQEPVDVAMYNPRKIHQSTSREVSTIPPAIVRAVVLAPNAV